MTLVLVTLQACRRCFEAKVRHPASHLGPVNGEGCAQFDMHGSLKSRYLPCYHAQRTPQSMHRLSRGCGGGCASPPTIYAALPRFDKNNLRMEEERMERENTRKLLVLTCEKLFDELPSQCQDGAVTGSVAFGS